MCTFPLVRSLILFLSPVMLKHATKVDFNYNYLSEMVIEFELVVHKKSQMKAS